ncbi:MAG TPA: GxxExxY protein, partial [Verrucomicrobiae bacterium]|nr:GxxExxY protein [Verrucomicrobiae bacterium]
RSSRLRGKQNFYREETKDAKKKSSPGKWRTIMGYGESTNPELERIARIIVDSIFKVHSTLGPGLLESVYSICLAHELRKRGLKVDREVILPVLYDGLRLESGLRLDLRVESCIIIETKAVEKLIPLFDAQLLTYLKLTLYKLGFLVNFNVPLIKDGIKRIIFTNKNQPPAIEP